MKKTLGVLLTAALAGALALTASGCGNSSRNLASLSSNWYSDTSFKNIQPTFTEERAEHLSYKVTQSEKSGNAYYSVSYADGTYDTLFYAKKITAAELKKITLEKWRDEYSEALGSDGSMYLYYYKTELSIPSVTFTCGDDEKTFGTQSVKSESYFLSVADYLAPVYTLRTVDRAVPAEFQSSSIDGCYSEIDMTYESFYNLSSSDVTTYITGSPADGERETFEVGGLTGNQNSVFDYTYLDIVVRAMRGLFSSSSLTFTLYTPGLQPRDYTASVGDSPLLSDSTASDAQLGELQTLLEGKGLFTPVSVDNGDGTQTPSKLRTKSVTISYNGGSFSGVSQTYWFAVDAANSSRTVMVKYSEPIVYGLGTLDYVLTEVINSPIAQ